MNTEDVQPSRLTRATEKFMTCSNNELAQKPR
jgi:hypothetical protein